MIAQETAHISSMGPMTLEQHDERSQARCAHLSNKLDQLQELRMGITSATENVASGGGSGFGLFGGGGGVTGAGLLGAGVGFLLGETVNRHTAPIMELLNTNNAGCQTAIGDLKAEVQGISNQITNSVVAQTALLSAQIQGTKDLLSTAAHQAEVQGLNNTQKILDNMNRIYEAQQASTIQSLNDKVNRLELEAHFERTHGERLGKIEQTVTVTNAAAASANAANFNTNILSNFEEMRRRFEFLQGQVNLAHQAINNFGTMTGSGNPNNAQQNVRQ
jgi:hypothetical protein